VAYYGKLAIHPDAVTSWHDFVSRAAIGPLPGTVVVLMGLVFHGAWVVVAIVTLRIEQRFRTARQLIASG
jgi:uncharacterized membrane protein